MDDTIFDYVSNEIPSNSSYKKLEDLYEKKTCNKKYFLIKKLVNLKFKEGCSIIAEHLNKTHKIVN